MLGKQIKVLAAGLAITLSGCATASAQQAGTLQDATVTVDFSQSRGERLHTERFNTWDNGDPEPELRPADVAFLNERGFMPKSSVSASKSTARLATLQRRRATSRKFHGSMT